MKKPLILITAFITASAAFGQNAKSTGITKTDVQSWIKNQKQIQQDFNEEGISCDDIANASAQEKAKAESILKPTGIAAPKRIEKYAMINQCATLVLAENGAGSGIDPNTMAMLKKMNVDPFAELRANTNQKDCKVVKANEKAIVNLMNEMDQTNAGLASASAHQTANTVTPSASSATKSGGAKSKDAAYAQAEQMRIANPEMTEEMAQKIRHQPGYAMQQAVWAKQQQGLASETQESAQNAEAQFKELNEKATKVKNAIDEFSKSKGDCGFIYKNADKTTKAYTKKEPASWESLMIHVQDNVVLFLPVTTKGKVEFKFTWEEPELKKVAVDIPVDIPDYAASDVETTEMSKTVPATLIYLNRKRRKFISETVPVTITNIEMYEASDKNSTAREYVISTKEGKVIHLWQKWSGDNWTTKVNFNGLKDASTWKWGETGGN